MQWEKEVSKIYEVGVETAEGDERKQGSRATSGNAVLWKVSTNPQGSLLSQLPFRSVSHWAGAAGIRLAWPRLAGGLGRVWCSYLVLLLAGGRAGLRVRLHPW